MSKNKDLPRGTLQRWWISGVRFVQIPSFSNGRQLAWLARDTKDDGRVMMTDCVVGCIGGETCSRRLWWM